MMKIKLAKKFTKLFTYLMLAGAISACQSRAEKFYHLAQEKIERRQFLDAVDLLENSAELEKNNRLWSKTNFEIARILRFEIHDYNKALLVYRDLILKSEGEPPVKDLVLVHFGIGKTGYYFDGLLEKHGDEFRIQLGSLNQEQSRRTPRMNVPSDYPAHFVALKLNGKEVAFESHLIDVNASGLQFIITPATPIKIGDHLVGIVKINKFKDVKLSGTVRHFRTLGNATYAGLEFNHREFGSENNLLELLAFFQHDVFYFNKKKAAG